MDNLMSEVSALTLLGEAATRPTMQQLNRQKQLSSGGVDSPTAPSPTWIWSKPSPGLLRRRAAMSNHNQTSHLFRPVSNSPPLMYTNKPTQPPSYNNNGGGTPEAPPPPYYHHEKKLSLVDSEMSNSSLEGFNSLELRRFELNRREYNSANAQYYQVNDVTAVNNKTAAAMPRASKLTDLRAISPPRISYRQRIKNRQHSKITNSGGGGECDKTQSSADSCYSRSDNSSELSEPPPPPRVPVLHPPLPPARNNYDTTSLSSISTAATSSSADLWNVRAMPNVKITRYDRPIYLRPNPSSSGGHHANGQHGVTGGGGQRSPRQNAFEMLTDEIMVKILSYLTSKEIVRTARVSRRFYFLSWEPDLWRVINLTGGGTNSFGITSNTADIDRSISTLFQVVAKNGVNLATTVKCFVLNGCSRLTDRGLALIARRCKSLEQLNVQYCTEITNGGLLDLTSRCSNLEHLDVTGCSLVSGVGVPYQQPAAVTSSCLATVHQPSARLSLHYLDMSDCLRLDDTSLRLVVESCPQLQYLFLRRCSQVTDIGIKSVASYCLLLRELSISDCTQLTDTSLTEIGRLGPSLRYLSLAKCDKITDVGIRTLVRHCYRLRYLNLRGLTEITDESIEWLARSCNRLRSLDIGKCPVSDYGLQYLSENCPNLKKLSVKGCSQVTDRGIGALSYYCRGLQQLNIQEVQGVTVQGCRVVRSNCRRCIIEHTNPALSA